MKLQDILKSLGDYGCLLLCYAELSGVSITDVIEAFDKLTLNGILGPDCFVKDADALMKYFNKPYTVSKVDVSEVPEDSCYIAKFERNGFGHFVICKNDKVVYNTLEDSKCVKYGIMNKLVRILKRI